MAIPPKQTVYPRGKVGMFKKLTLSVDHCSTTKRKNITESNGEQMWEMLGTNRSFSLSLRIFSLRVSS